MVSCMPWCSGPLTSAHALPTVSARDRGGRAWGSVRAGGRASVSLAPAGTSSGRTGEGNRKRIHFSYDDELSMLG